MCTLTDLVTYSYTDLRTLSYSVPTCTIELVFFILCSRSIIEHISHIVGRHRFQFTQLPSRSVWMVDSGTNVTYATLLGIEPVPIFVLIMMWGLMSSDVGLTYYITRDRL